MSKVRCSGQRARDAVAVTTLFMMAMFVLCGSANAAFYVNCGSCHGTAQSGMFITNYQTTINLGQGLRKVFQVKAGQTAVIQWSVTNGHGGNYGLNINNLGAGGVYNGSDHMAYTPDGNWAIYFPGTSTNFYMVGCTTTSPELWNFNLAVKTNTPADFYTVQTQMAGYDSADTMWSQQETFYVQVVAAPPNLGVSMAGTSVMVSWPNTGACALQQNSNLAASAAWAASGYAVTTNANGTNSVTIEPQTGNMFFRLGSP